MTTTLDPPHIVRLLRPAKKAIRLLSGPHGRRRINRLYRQLFRGRLQRTRNFAAIALKDLAHQAYYGAAKRTKETGADDLDHYYSLFPPIGYVPETPAFRAKLGKVLLTAIDRGWLSEKISDWPASAQLVLYPRVAAHVICHSLGYATPGKAASIATKAFDQDASYCEWIDSMVSLQAGEDYRAAAARVTRRTVTYGVSSNARRSHRGYMADYGQARLAVICELLGRGPTFASWF